MPENEFDKKVSFELQGLKFKPSEPVWMKVEERIRKKKKRRVFIVFFLLAGIALLGYWQWDNFFGSDKETVAKTEAPVPVKTGADQTTEENADPDKQQINLPTNSNEEKNGPGKSGSTDISVDRVANNDKTVKELTAVALNPVKKNNRTRNAKPVQKKEIVLTESDLAILTNDEPVQKKDDEKKSSVFTDGSQVLFKDSRITDTKVDSINVVDADPNPEKTIVSSYKTDSAGKKDVPKKDSVVIKMDSSKVIAVDSPAVRVPKMKKRSWSFGIEFTPGIASFGNELFSFNTSKSAADLNSAPAPGNTFSAGPAETNAGFGFQLGGFAEKQLTKRSSLSIGLRWSYYSDKLNIGPVVYPTNSSTSYSQTLDRLGTSYAFRASGTGSYTEKYHFIEMPLTYQVQLNKNTVHPFSLRLGFKVGRLLSSNAIAYDTAANGIYYRSTKYINNTQFGFTAGFNWKINKSDKIKVVVGPVVDLHLNSLVDNPFDNRRYLMFSGVRASIQFNSKK